MSQLKLEAEVVIDNAKSSAALKATATDLSNAKVSIVDTAKAALAARRDLAELEKGARGASAAAKAELEPALRAAKERLVDAGQATKLAAANFKQLQGAANDVGPAIDRATRSAGQMRAGSAQLGQQLQDVAIQAQSGTSAFTILAQQGGQTAFALSQMGGAAGRVGTFLSGPLGAGLILATALLGPFVARLFDSENASKKATEGLTEFQRRQSDIGNFIDNTTGKLTEQNTALIRNAILTRQAAIEKNREKIAEGTAAAFASAGKAAVTGQRFVAERQPFANVYDPEIAAVIAKAGKDVEKLDAGLFALVRRRPGLAATVLEISNAAAETVLLQRAERQKLKEIEQLTGKTQAQGTATSGLIEKQVALATATTAVERARARYSLVLEQGNAATKAGGKAADEYRARLTEAARAVNSAEAAEKRATAGRREGAKALREQARDSKAFATEAQKLANYLGKITSNAISFEIAVPSTTELRSSIAARQRAETPGIGPDDELSEISRAIGERFGDRVDEAGNRFLNAARNVADTFDQIAVQFAKNLFNGADAGKDIDLAAAGGNIAVAIVASIADTFLNEALKPILDPLNKVASVLGKVAGAILKYTTPIGLLTALLSKPKTGSASLANVAGVGTVTGTSGNNQKRIDQATKLGDSVLGTIQGIVDQLGGTLGDFAVSIGIRNKKFVVDPTGDGRTKGRGTTKFKQEADAVSAVIADAIRDGAIGGVSPRLQAVLRQYATNIDKAVTEALKVKGLEDLIAEDADPFAGIFREEERLRAQRLVTARQYGFDLVAIEKLNAKEREAAIKDTLESTTSTVRALLDDLKFGTRATGSAAERQASLSAERDRLAGLIRAGDSSQLDPLAKIAQQLVDLESETFGATRSTGRTETTALLNDLVQQTEDRIRASAKAAEDVQKQLASGITELNTTGDEQVAQLSGIGLTLSQLLAAVTAGGKTAGATGASSSLSQAYARLQAR